MADEMDIPERQLAPEAANAGALAQEIVENSEVLAERWARFVDEYPDVAVTLRQIANTVAEGDTLLKERFLWGFTLELILRERTEQGQIMETMLEGEAKQNN